VLPYRCKQLYFALNKPLSAGLVHLLVFFSCDYHLASDGASLAMSIHRQIDGPFSKVYRRTLQLGIDLCFWSCDCRWPITRSSDWLRLCYTFLYNNSLIPWRPQNPIWWIAFMRLETVATRRYASTLSISSICVSC